MFVNNKLLMTYKQPQLSYDTIIVLTEINLFGNKSCFPAGKYNFIGDLQKT